MVYVDALVETIPGKRWPYKKACHLLADSDDELHAAAQAIGLKRAWFQTSTLHHYDLTASKRKLALEQGATEVDRKWIAHRVRHKRAP